MDDPNGAGDVLIVAHGHILRAFAQRWAGQSLHGGPSFLLEAGGVGILRWAVLVCLRVCSPVVLTRAV